MMRRVCVLLVFVLGLTEPFPLATPPSTATGGQNMLVPVTVLSSLGPQLVLVPVNKAELDALRNPTPTQPAPTHTLTLPQNQMKAETEPEGESVNSLFLQPNTFPNPSVNTYTLVQTPESAQAQGQLFPVWNTIPVIPLQPTMVGQAFFPSLLTPAGGARVQTQVVSVIRQALGSNSESSEEGGATQVIYILPVSDEIINMGIVQGGQEGGTATDTDTDTDPEPGNLQLPSPSPTPLAGLQLSPAPEETASPAVGVTEQSSAGVQQPPAGGSVGPTTKPCTQKNKRAKGHANRHSL
ncbi:uncharacterized protein si:ch211-149b19.4 isoform X2 [Hoplias malabaricus]|uniref:uncharacterized protein si:ch211-149b19.4 isoform X2 n=1 Tax=Hoplias malabaricus TaxID=27720 RepID=UPI0034629037